MKYKAQLRIPMAEPYAYIEVSVEDTPEGILEAYRGITASTKGGTGLDRPVWNQVIENLLTDESMDVSVFEQMTEKQREFVHEIKKALARLKSKGLLAESEQGLDI